MLAIPKLAWNIAILRPLLRHYASAVGKRRRIIGELMAALIVVAIVAVVGIMLFLMFGGMLRGGGRAALTVTASGTASPDGTLASITLVVQNTGDGAARISNVFIEAVGGAPAAVTPSFLGVTGVSLTVGAPTVPASMPTGAGPFLDISPRASQTITIRMTAASGLFPGHQYRITVVYFDVGSRTPATADTIVTLR